MLILLGIPSIVSNAPCGVERSAVEKVVSDFITFLMHRVELKAVRVPIGNRLLRWFLMHRVELKAPSSGE